MQKSKIMNTYRSVKRRMQSRFIRGGVLSAKLFLVSSKKSEQDFLETYIETVRDDPHAIIVDEPQWVIKPAGTYSGRTFKVAVGDKIRKSKIVKDEDDLEDLLKAGYRVIDVPIEFKRDFIRDVDQSLMEFAGISSSLTTKFISYEDLSKCYCESPNPFSRNVISIGTKDDILIQDFFKPELVNENLFSKPHYLHLDMSLTGDRTGISDVCIIGVRDEERYENGDFVPVREMVYKHVFSVAIQCPPGAGNEISLEKNRRFIYYLRHNLGWNIVGVSLDGYQCLTEDALIKTNHGNKKIVDLELNDKVISYDEESGSYLYSDFRNLRKTGDSDLLYHINISDGREIVCTGNHQILTDRGYVRADELETTDFIMEYKNVL